MYTTSYRYDSFGRLLELVLPDSETVTYVYDAGGSLQSFAGDKSGTHVSYLNLVHYDKFEQRTRLILGNGIETKYAYDPASRRLDTLTSAGARAGTFQNLHYGYDKVGNILKLHNQVDVPPPTTFGGPNQQSFGYDDLYRLTTAQGEYKSAPDKTRNYTLDLTYDSNHNILAKKQSDVVTVAGGSAITQKGTSYDWQYDYAGRQPHAPTHIGNRSFSYDLNGNQTGWQSDVNGTRRFIQWDEENRIAEIDDNGERNRYVYDAAGERTVKLTKQGETVYVNQYYVVRNRSVVSKHLYAGSGRVVTHLVMGTAPGNEGRGAPGNGHGSNNTPTTPETGNGNSGNVVKGNNGQDKDHTNNGLHLGQLKNGKENPGQGRDRRSDTANAHAQDVYQNPTLTGTHPGQGSENRSDKAISLAQSPTPQLVVTEGEASVELGGDTSGGEGVEGVTATTSTPTVNGQSEFIWYYHPDHLGSTGFVTDQNGELYEHVEYFPFGETWVQEHSNTQRTPYLYTGKELDEETGLYYYGARYYDPRTSVWQSGDRILDLYLSGKGNGGVYNSANLALYGYSYHKPLTLNDPDGNIPVDTVWDALNIVYDLGKAGVGYAVGNPAMVAEGLADAAVDTAAMAVPYLPAGASKIARMTAEGAEKYQDAKGVDKKVSVGQLGRDGEAKASAITGTGKNTQKFSVNGRDRIPDQVNASNVSTKKPLQITEVKNVKTQSFTRQLKDDVDLVGPGGRVDVFVRPGSKITGPLQRAHDDPTSPINVRPEL